MEDAYLHAGMIFEAKIVGDLTWLQSHDFLRANAFTDGSTVHFQVFIVPEDFGDSKEQWQEILLIRHVGLPDATKRLRALLTVVHSYWLEPEDPVPMECQNNFLTVLEV